MTSTFKLADSKQQNKAHIKAASWLPKYWFTDISSKAKEAWARFGVSDTIKLLANLLYYKHNEGLAVSSAVWLVEFSCATVTKPFKKVIADPTWVQSTIATSHGMC